MIQGSDYIGFTNKRLMADIIQWDIKSWQEALRFWEENVKWDKVRNALELGAHRGGLSLWLALKGKEVVCSDIGDPKRYAQPLHNKYKVGDLIDYKAIDATSMPYENCFDLVVFKSIIGGIGIRGGLQKQQQVFNQIFKALRPGGYLLFAENLRATAFHMILRRAFMKRGKDWRYVSINEMKTFLKEFSCFIIKTTGFLATLGRNESQRTLLSILDAAVFNRILPDDWKYIAFGIAVK